MGRWSGEIWVDKGGCIQCDLSLECFFVGVSRILGVVVLGWRSGVESWARWGGDVGGRRAGGAQQMGRPSQGTAGYRLRRTERAEWV